MKEYPVTLLLGPRQCGKTTLAMSVASERGAHRFDLEDPQVPLQPETAATVLRELRGLIVIDEIQRQPRLLELLRVLADRRPLPARFLILGSASLDLVRGVSESLAGRVAYVQMGGFSLDEVTDRRRGELWVRGGFPGAFLPRDTERSFRWRVNFTQSILERDLPQLGIRIPAAALRRFWTMLAHCHGGIWNAADLARSMSVKEDTARRYLDVLTGAFMVRQLPPWFENVGKRLVKAPKVYIRDSGILHCLLGLKDRTQVMSHPKLGLSWEGFVIEEIVRRLNADGEAYFYKTHGGAELDLLVLRAGRRYGFEVKFADAPAPTRSMREVSKDLRLDHLWVVHPGRHRIPLGQGMDAVPLGELSRLLAEL